MLANFVLLGVCFSNPVYCAPFCVTLKEVITEIFHNLSMRVKVRHAPEEGSAVAALVAGLRELDCMHFEGDM